MPIGVDGCEDGSGHAVFRTNHLTRANDFAEASHGFDLRIASRISSGLFTTSYISLCFDPRKFSCTMASRRSISGS